MVTCQTHILNLVGSIPTPNKIFGDFFRKIWNLCRPYRLVG